MRIMNWNIEWMNNWFVGYGELEFKKDHPSSGITNIDKLCTRVANVIKSLDPDVLTIQEGPSDIREMKLFVDNYLTDAEGDILFDVFGGIDGGAQKLYTLIKIKGKYKNYRIASDELTTALQEPWEADIDADNYLEGYEFTRLPLVVEGLIEDGGLKLRIITLHTKSKYVHKGESLWENPNKKIQFVIAALKNRRRISSEAMRVRIYLNDLLKNDNSANIVVTGDFNDGPGIDYFERNYLTHNVTDILLGSSFYPSLLFKHAFLGRVEENKCYTAIFNDYIDDSPNRHLLLDHILVSPVLSLKIKESDIAHTEYDAETDNTASGRQKHVSDHRPVYIDF